MKLFLIFSAMLSAALPVYGFVQEDPGNPVCILKTGMGDISVELYPREAPKTVENFIALSSGRKEFFDAARQQKVQRAFYDGLIFHRVIQDFMIQGGCPKGDGTGGPGFEFGDEINAAALGLDKIKAIQPDGRTHPYLLVRNPQDFYRVVLGPLYARMGIHSREQFEERKQEVEQRLQQITLKECYENLGYEYTDALPSRQPVRGVVAMANSGPGTNGSQFFIPLVDTPWLAGKHTVFGKVIEGMDVVDRIGVVPVSEGGKPRTDVVIQSLRLYERKQPE